MKIIRAALHILLIYSAINSTAYSAVNGNGDNGDDLRYDREQLLQERDSFISANGDLTIRKLTIRGLNKTDESVVLKEYEISDGDKLSSFNPHLFINRLKRKNIFTDIHISYIKDDEFVIIDLSLSEKWTIIPLPMFYSNGETATYGIYILESNFMGYGKTVFTGGTFSADSRSAIFGYVDPSVYGTDFIGNIFIIYKDSIVENGTENKVIFSKYSSKQETFRLDAGYDFLKKVKLYISGGYNSGKVDHNYNGSFNTPDSVTYYLSGAQIKLDMLSYYEYLFYGLKGEVKIYAHIPVDDEKEYNTTDFKIDYSHKIFNYHRITVYAGGSSGNKPGVLEDRISGKTGTRTLPADIISADNFINYSLIYEYPFFRLNWGAVTLLALWEQGVYNKDDSEYNNYSGPGCGVLLYLKRIAFPAMGFNYARNLKTGNNEFSINVGYAF